MIVERWTWTVRPAHQDEFVGAVKALVEAHGLTPRVCTYRFGGADRVTSDLKFESFLDREKWWENADRSRPEYIEFQKKQLELAEPGRVSELLIVH
jgi:hypothetical protein